MHEHYEMAIEREQHGALDEAQSLELAEHLIGCASCRAYQRSTREMESDMEATSTLFSDGVQWGYVKSALDSQLRDRRSRFHLSTALTLAFFAVGLAYCCFVLHGMPHPTSVAIWFLAGGRRLRKVPETGAVVHASVAVRLEADPNYVRRLPRAGQYTFTRDPWLNTSLS